MSTLALGRRRMSAWRVLAAAAAAVTGLSIYSYLSWLRAQVPLTGRLVPMVVAARDLAPGTVIDAPMVEIARHPERYLPSGALGNPGQAVGRVVGMPILAGEPVVARRLGKGGGASALVPPGMRAYRLVASRAGFVPGPGDRVDVIATFPAEVYGEPTAVTLLRGSEVRSVESGSPVATEAPGSIDGLAGGQQSDLAITVLVRPEEAEHLAMAETLGRLSIVLAPLEGEALAPPPPVTKQDLGGR